jgi:hypothetical protein
MGIGTGGRDFIDPPPLLPSLQVRAYGSAVPMPLLSTLTTPIRLLVPWAGTLAGGLDSLGRRRVPFVGAFDPDPYAWAWDSSAVRLEASRLGLVTVRVGGFGAYAALGAKAGCDAIPASRAVWDSCGVCQGDNSSCSGCDGIPNTGRSKNCSGNGRCEAGSPRCKCRAGWYGELCNTSCSLEGVCGGRGYCDPDTGLVCYCFNDWATPSPPPAYPGPFCTRFVGAVENATAIAAAKAAVLDIILYVALPIAAAAIVGLLLALYLFTASKRRRQKLLAKILDFSPAGASPDTAGWAPEMPPPAGGDAGGAAGGAVAAGGAAAGGAAGRGLVASAVAASVRAEVERREEEKLQERTGLLRGHMARAVTSKLYSGGPMELRPVLRYPVAREDYYATDTEEIAV